MELKFYKCDVCGQVLIKINDRLNPITCCDKKVREIIPLELNDERFEKHVPRYKIRCNKVYVCVGFENNIHPSNYEHHIEWIMLVTNKGYQLKYLCPTDIPSAIFMLSKNEKVLEIYSYCNLHSLWVNRIDSRDREGNK